MDDLEENSNTGDKSKELIINKWPLKNHLYGLLAISLLTILSGLYLDKIIDTEYPYLESFPPGELIGDLDGS